MLHSLRNKMVAFDADALIYTGVPGHSLGVRVEQLLNDTEDAPRIGSTLLISELLIKPLRLGRDDELTTLKTSLARLQLISADETITDLAVTLGAKYNLKTVDATHLATAVYASADVFITNNHKDFKAAQVLELGIIFPAEL